MFVLAGNLFGGTKGTDCVYWTAEQLKFQFSYLSLVNSLESVCTRVVQVLAQNLIQVHTQNLGLPPLAQSLTRFLSNLLVVVDS